MSQSAYNFPRSHPLQDITGSDLGDILPCKSTGAGKRSLPNFVLLVLLLPVLWFACLQCLVSFANANAAPDMRTVPCMLEGFACKRGVWSSCLWYACSCLGPAKHLGPADFAPAFVVLLVGGAIWSVVCVACRIWRVICLIWHVVCRTWSAQPLHGCARTQPVAEAQVLIGSFKDSRRDCIQGRRERPQDGVERTLTAWKDRKHLVILITTNPVTVDRKCTPALVYLPHTDSNTKPTDHMGVQPKTRCFPAQPVQSYLLLVASSSGMSCGNSGNHIAAAAPCKILAGSSLKYGQLPMLP